MRNKQKMWRRPEVQAKVRAIMIDASLAMAEKVNDPKATRFFLDNAVSLRTSRMGQHVKAHFQAMPKLA